MKLHGLFPSPYGVPVKIYPDDGAREDDDSFQFDIDGVMTVMGIYDADDRKACKEAAAQGGDVFELYGGRPVARIPIPRPRCPAYEWLTRGGAADIPIENWVTAIMDEPYWHLRAPKILEIIGLNLSHADETQASRPVYGLSLSMMMTAAVEHLCEDEIDCLEAAAVYALAAHEEWRAAGLEWLEPHRSTWFRDWVRCRPVYRDFARRCMALNYGLPAWIDGDGV